MIRKILLDNIPDIPTDLSAGPDYWDKAVSFESTDKSEQWFNDLLERCIHIVSGILGKTIESSNVPKIIRVNEEGLPLHVDGGDSDVSCIVYLETPSFGGELVFTKMKQTIKPMKNLMVFFPNTEEYAHMVNVFEGERLVFVAFLKFK